jgi:RNA-directed DNA polymerase
LSFRVAAQLRPAYLWLIGARAKASPNADIWDLRRNWPQLRQSLKKQITTGTYLFAPLQRVRHATEPAYSWSAQDALVLKALTLALADILPTHDSCTHVAGHGGLKRAVRDVATRKQQDPATARYVCRTDVKSFYASIDHFALLDQLSPFVPDKRVMSLLVQYLRRTHEHGGTFYSVTRGISAGCPLSPLIGAFHLYKLDCLVTQKHPRCFYIRYMDDILILAPSRWQLRRAIATMNGVLEELGLEQHPDKTTIGPVARGFDFLGYTYSPASLGLAEKTISNHRIKLTRLYERYHRQLRAYRSGWIGQSTILRTHDGAQAYLNPRPSITSHDDITRLLEAYQGRFTAWASGGLQSCETIYGRP